MSKDKLAYTVINDTVFSISVKNTCTSKFLHIPAEGTKVIDESDYARHHVELEMHGCRFEPLKVVEQAPEDKEDKEDKEPTAKDEIKKTAWFKK